MTKARQTRLQLSFSISSFSLFLKTNNKKTSLFRNHLVKTLVECGYTYQEIMSSPVSVRTHLIAANYAPCIVCICFFFFNNIIFFFYFTSIQSRLESLIQDYVTF